jgi:UrcA family protein
MNTQSILSGRFGGRHTACGAAILMALFGIVPVGTIADQRPATTTVSSVADVSLSDLNLSSPEGMRLARERLHTMAERLCADRGGGRASATEMRLGKSTWPIVGSITGTLTGVMTFTAALCLVASDIRALIASAGGGRRNDFHEARVWQRGVPTGH